MSKALLLMLCLLLAISLCHKGASKWSNEIYMGESDDWKYYSTNGIYIDIEFDELDLCKVPKVLTSI